MSGRTPEQRALSEEIGERLRWAREAAGLNSYELAAKVGCDYSMIRYLEKGARAPSVFLCLSLCHTLGVSPQYLLWGTLDGIAPKLAAKLHQLHGDRLLPPALMQRRDIPNPGKTRTGVKRSG